MDHWNMLLKPIREHLEHDLGVLAGAVCFIRRREKIEPAEWRPISGMDDCKVSSLGQVIRKGKLAPWDVNSSLYPMVTLAPGVRRLVHVLVAEAFLGPCPEGHQVDHEDENTLNPSLGNLKYATRSVNVGRQRRGKRRLGEADRQEVRRRAATESIHGLAAEFGVSTTTIRGIARDVLTSKPGTVAKRKSCSVDRQTLSSDEEIDPFS